MKVSAEVLGDCGGVALDDEIEVEGWSTQEEIANGAADKVEGDAGVVGEADKSTGSISKMRWQLAEPFIDKFWVFHGSSVLMVEWFLDRFSGAPYDDGWNAQTYCCLLESNIRAR